MIKLKDILNEGMPSRSELRTIESELNKAIKKNGGIAASFKGTDTKDDGVDLLYGKYDYGVDKKHLYTDYGIIRKSVEQIESKFKGYELMADRDDKYVTVYVTKRI